MRQGESEDRITIAKQQSQICLKLFPVLPKNIFQEAFCKDCTELHKKLCTEIIQTKK